MERIHLQLPLDKETVLSLKAGDLLSLSGVLYTARDAAHKRLIEALDQNQPLPLELAGQTIYYAGPCPAGRVFRSVQLDRPRVAAWTPMPRA